ncbi:hypothetical protein [Pantoea rwandensis]|nr:hypothetical protein [Pantoea rwandensis]
MCSDSMYCALASSNTTSIEGRWMGSGAMYCASASNTTTSIEGH